MSQNSTIQWTEATWNPTTGCTKISDGCKNCYIERTPPFRMNGRKFVNGKIPLILHEDRLDAPLHWKKPRMIFVNSLSDLFHEDVPDSFIDQVFAVMALCPQHTFQVLTKRAERMAEYTNTPNLGNRIYDGFLGREWDRVHEQATSDTTDGSPIYDFVQWRLPLPNAWLGVSVENKKHGLPRIEHLLKTPAAVRFLSVEPLLEEVVLPWHCCPTNEGDSSTCMVGQEGCLCDRLHWVIVGGESGPGSRPCDIAWIRSIIAQCKAAGVPCFVKQLGSIPIQVCGQCGRTIGKVLSGFTDACGPTHTAMIAEMMRIGKSKGGDPLEWPQDLRIREMPAKREAVTDHVK